MAGNGMTFVGVDPAKGDLVAVVLDQLGAPYTDALDVIALPRHGTPAARLLDVKDRIVQHLERLKPRLVAVFGTTKYSAWKLNDLRPRAHLEAALMVAAAEAGVVLEEVSPHDAAKTLAVPHAEIPDRVPEIVTLEHYTKRDRRARAVAAAWHAAGINPGTLRGDE